MENRIEDILNRIAVDREIADFGKYTKEALTKHMMDNYKLNPDFLAQYGFAITDYQNIENAPHAFRTFYTFTDRWRLLRSLGSYDNLLSHEADRNRKQEEKIDLEYSLLKSQVDFQKINNDFLIRQTDLIQNQIQTNNLSKVTNVYIAIFTFIATEYSCYELIDKAVSIL